MRYTIYIAGLKPRNLLQNPRRSVMNRYAKALQTAGMEIIGEIDMVGQTYQVASISAGYGFLRVLFNERGDARLDKPNRTKKWLYEKTPAQLLAVVKQTLSFYNFGR